MGIGLGVILLLAGIILVSNVVNFDMNNVDDNGLGWILIIVGALAIVLSLIINAQRTRGVTHVERRIEE
jgi:drug/metabolite transporter (DMT)-like permease